mmetsp:Transcript_37058/g.38424  ORF Transcript_37058/g.38424 Transcript_37058/m.38424 type:complete len:140 (+) Transcript_37058:225-644(+)
MKDELVMSYLKDVQNNLFRQYDFEYISSAPAYRLSAFETQIQELNEYYESAPRQSVTGNIIKDLNDVKKMVVKNIDKLMDRENTLELTINNSQKLKDSSIKVNNFSNVIKKEAIENRNRTRMYVFGGIIGLIVLFYILI